MSLRLLIYMARIWDDWMRNRNGEWPPPPIVPMVLYHGEGQWNRSTEFADLFELEPTLSILMALFIPSFSFLLDDLSALPDEELQRRELTARAMQEGRQEGRQEERIRLLLRQLSLRFGQLSPETNARIQAADEQALERFSEHVITATTLSGVFDDS